MDALLKRSAAAGALLLFLVLASPLWAADMMLLIPGIKGNSPFFSGGIQVTSFSYGVSNTGTVGSGGSSGRAMFNDLVITKPVDLASPVFYHHCASGQRIQEATLYVRRTLGGDKGAHFMVLKLEDVLVTSCSSQGAGDELGQEVITLTYGKIEKTISGFQDDRGSVIDPVIFRWNRETNTPQTD